MKASFTIVNYGTLYGVRPNDDDARAHLEVSVSDEAQWWAGTLIVEPRYLEGFVALVRADGWSVA